MCLQPYFGKEPQRLLRGVSEAAYGLTAISGVADCLNQRFPTFLTRGALFRINFYGGAPCLPYVLQDNGV